MNFQQREMGNLLFSKVMLVLLLQRNNIHIFLPKCISSTFLSSNHSLSSVLSDTPFNYLEIQVLFLFLTVPNDVCWSKNITISQVFISTEGQVEDCGLWVHRTVCVCNVTVCPIVKGVLCIFVGVLSML